MRRPYNRHIQSKVRGRACPARSLEILAEYQTYLSRLQGADEFEVVCGGKKDVTAYIVVVETVPQVVDVEGQPPILAAQVGSRIQSVVALAV